MNDNSPQKNPSETEVKEDTNRVTTVQESDEDERRRWQKPELVIERLGPLEDKIVADLGAGIGYFVFKLVPKAKRVIAIDVDKEKIGILNEFKNSSSFREELKEKLDIRLSPPDNSMLKEGEADIILIVNTVAYIKNRVSYFKHLKSSLNDKGQIVIVDFKTKIIPEYVAAPPYDEREYLHVLEEELIEAGFNIEKTDDTSLEFQYMIFARK